MRGVNGASGGRQPRVIDHRGRTESGIVTADRPFLEYAKAATPLVEGSVGQPGFDLVVPSLPGYVFCDPPRRPGLHPGRVGGLLLEQLERLRPHFSGLQTDGWLMTAPIVTACLFHATLLDAAGRMLAADERESD